MSLARSSLILFIFKMTIGQSTISKDYFPDVEYPASVSEVEPFYYKPSERDLFDSLGTEIKSTTFANVTEVRDNKPISGVKNNDFTKSRSSYINVDDRNNTISLTNNREELINDTFNIENALNEQEVNNAINKIVDNKSIEGVENDSETNINNLIIHNSKPSLRVLNKYSKDNNSNIIYEYTTPSMILNVTSNSTYDTSNDLAAEDITVEAVAVVQVYLNPVLKNSDDGDDSLNTNSGPDELGNTNISMEEVAQNIETDVGQVASNVDTDKLQNIINTEAGYSQINNISSNKSMEEIVQNNDSEISNVDKEDLENSIDTMTVSSQISEISLNKPLEEIVQNNDSDVAQISNVDTDGLENSIDTKTASSQISEISLNKSMKEIVQNTDTNVTQISSNELETSIDTKTANSQISEISSNNTNGVNVKNDIVPTSDVAVLDAPQKNNTIGHLLYIGGTQDLNNAKNLVYLGKYTQPLQFFIKRA